MLGGHKARGVRLIVGSHAADWSSDFFLSEVEKYYHEARGHSRSSDAWRQSMQTFDMMLRPGYMEDECSDEEYHDTLPDVQVTSPRPETGG